MSGQRVDAPALGLGRTADLLRLAPSGAPHSVAGSAGRRSAGDGRGAEAVRESLSFAGRAC